MSAVCYVPAVGVGGRTELQPSQARQAGLDQLCDTATSAGLTPEGGVTSSTPSSAGHTGTLASPLCECVCECQCGPRYCSNKLILF